MDKLLSLAFEAHNTEKNHHRRYELTVGRDLFGHWTVSVNSRRGRRLDAAPADHAGGFTSTADPVTLDLSDSRTACFPMDAAKSPVTDLPSVICHGPPAWLNLFGQRSRSRVPVNGAARSIRFAPVLAVSLRCAPVTGPLLLPASC